MIKTSDGKEFTDLDAAEYHQIYLDWRAWWEICGTHKEILNANTVWEWLNDYPLSLHKFLTRIIKSISKELVR